MPIDIAIIIIMSIFLILGFKIGFVYNLFFAFGWLISVIVAFFTRGYVQGFLQDKTPVYDWYHGLVYKICLKLAPGYEGAADADITSRAGITEGSSEAGGNALSDVLGAAGHAMGSAVQAVGEGIAKATADSIASTSFGVFCFIGTVLLVKLLLFLITLALSSRYRGGFVGALDSIGGALLGIVQGFIVVFVILFVILPVSLALNQGIYDAVAQALNTSFFAKTLFLANPIITIVNGFSPGLFNPSEWL
jgi:uncharacterized membrane protein required for colicin V production